MIQPVLVFWMDFDDVISQGSWRFQLFCAKLADQIPSHVLRFNVSQNYRPRRGLEAASTAAMDAALFSHVKVFNCK